MNKMLLFILLTGFCLSLFALQADEELSMQTLFDAKHGLNRSTHAAAQQTDLDKLSRGVWDIDEQQARTTALQYLKDNLRLDDTLAPLPGTFLKRPVEVLVFEVIHSDQTFPFEYINAPLNYRVTLERPGVVMIVRLSYPRIFPVMAPITWLVKSASELVEITP